MNQMPALETAASGDCWNRIGMGGDGSCVELSKVIHCRNCPVYSDAGRGLLDRATWGDYRAEWTSLLARQNALRTSATHSVVIFMLGGEHLALPTTSFREVIATRVVHRLPARRHKILMGLINVRGEIQLCVSLAALLGLDSEPEAKPGTHAADGRMLVVEHGKEAWVFPVSKVYGTFRFDPTRLEPVPATLQNAHTGFSRGAIAWEGKSVGCLDEAAVFAAVRKGIA